MLDVRGALERALRAALDELGATEVEAAVEACALPELGDWSTPAALRCARVLRRPPMEIAAAIRERLEAARIEHVETYAISPPGYVNAQLGGRSWGPAVIREAMALDVGVPVSPPPGMHARRGKVLIEHTSINTNKAAHIGHLRNACIGDTIARALRRIGTAVEVQNYIDDTGVQVADVVVGLRELGMEPRPGEPYDQFCSRVYVEVRRRQETDASLRERTRATLQAIEQRDNEVATFAKHLAGRIVDAHLATMGRFGIGYDLLSWESDILGLGFWRRAFGLLREAGVIVRAESGKNVGCWVMPLVTVEGEESQPRDEAVPETDDRTSKVLVKSDGIATYTAKDIAYQLWKFGLLGIDFHYRRWRDQPTAPATTQADATDAVLDGHGFGAAQHVVTVIDVRQTYPQMVVRAALRRLGHEVAAAHSVHVGYEVVALTPRAAAVLGFEADGEGAVALSGRRGIEVRVDDLLDRATALLREKAADDTTARALAVGGVRYYLEKFALSTVIAFDFDEALRVTGDTGVYLQYAHARAAGVLRRVPKAAGEAGEPRPRGALVAEERALLHRIEGYPRALAEAAEALAPAVLAAYAFELASALTDLYEHTPPMVREQDPEVRRFRRALVAAARVTLADVLGVLGIPAPDRI